ncbi:MAG TPA: sugar phosphate isomerase/epimerase [Chloroflexota bacterium]|nr:sugar phosphate isomerase/epimerase [Chloroflexota bacterium]
MTSFRLGCNTVLFGMVDVETALQHIAWAGYDGAELAALPSMADHLQLDQDRAYYQGLRRLATDLGLDLYAIEAATADPGRLESVLRAAAELEIPVVAIGSGGKTGDEASFQQSVTLGRQLAELAGRHGVKLAMKPHVGAAVYNTETALRAWREIGSPHLGLNFDPSHLHRAAEDVASAARAFAAAGALLHSHFRDCPSREIPGPGKPEEQIPGRGEVDLTATLQALAEAGYTGVLDLEVIGAKTYPLSRAMGIAAESRGYLHRALHDLGLRSPSP